MENPNKSTLPAGFNNNLTLGGPTPIGARKAALTERVKPYLMEVALNEQVQPQLCLDCCLASLQLPLDCPRQVNDHMGLHACRAMRCSRAR